jgi:O-antigen/teichoic acid export membrane protein
LFGPEYAASAPVLAVLAVGFFFHSALGANQLMLRVCGRVREVVIIDVVAVLLGLGLYLQLIPRFGAMGAAVGTTATFIIHKLLSHHALVRADIGVGPLDRRYLRLYFQMAGTAVALLLLQSMLDPPIYLSLPLAMLASVYLMRTTRKLVRIEETFPELLRFPLLKWLVR